MNSQKFLTATTPVNKIRFEYKRLKEIFQNNLIKNNHLKEHAKSITVYDIDNCMDVNPSQFVEECRFAYPNCQEYSFSFLRRSNKEICTFLNL